MVPPEAAPSQVKGHHTFYKELFPTSPTLSTPLERLLILHVLHPSPERNMGMSFDVVPGVLNFTLGKFFNTF